MRICIDPGHGGNDTGAVNGFYKESAGALLVALKLGANLTRAGHDVIYTRTSNIARVALQERCDIARDRHCDYFCSIHFNSCADERVTGIETFAYDVSQLTANRIQERLVLITNAKDRGVKCGSHLYVLRHTTMPACLVECGFMSNPGECLNLFDGNYQAKLAKAICEGICAGCAAGKW